MTALALDTFNLTKRFGAFTALDGVSLAVRPGTVHALLGENGAGKSTLVKCVVGYQRAEAGSVLLDGREHDIASPTVARALGIGMVYQHFTVVPGLTVAENLLLARGGVPLVVDWKAARSELEAFLRTTPFKLPLDATPLDLSAGEKQKLEILKQLFLKPRLLILDEPTSVLTPQEADEVLGALRERAHAGATSIVLITHKFREVTAYADDVSVLRRGKLVTSTRVADTSAEKLAEAMVGERAAARDPVAWQRQPNARGAPVLQIRELTVRGDRGEQAVRELTPRRARRRDRRRGRRVGQRPARADAGAHRAARARERPACRSTASPTAATRSAEPPPCGAQPARGAAGQRLCRRDSAWRATWRCAASTGAPLSRSGWMRWGRVAQRARELIAEYGVKTQGEGAAIRTLSGGNVQRAVLARELSGQARLLLVANPVFGLDFAAVAEIHARLMAARNAWRGGAVDQRGSRRAARAVGPHRGHQRGPHRARDAGRQADRRTLGAHMGGKAHMRGAHA